MNTIKHRDKPWDHIKGIMGINYKLSMGVSINGGIQEWFIAENTIEIMDDKTPIWQITFFLSVNHPVYHLFLWAIYTMIKKKKTMV